VTEFVLANRGLRTLLAIFFPLVVIAALNLRTQALISRQEARNRLLESELKEARAGLEELRELEPLKADLLARMQVWQHLRHTNEPNVVEILDAASRHLPTGVRMDSIARLNRQVIVSTGPLTAQARADLLAELTASPLFSPGPGDDGAAHQKGQSSAPLSLALLTPGSLELMSLMQLSPIPLEHSP
jgi:Tfp pilus assembly protein PilN